MKLLTFNVEDDYRGIEEKIRVVVDLVHQSDADAVGLQEVTPLMYPLLHAALTPEYVMSPALHQAFFNVLLSRLPGSPITHLPFSHTRMNRGYTWQQLDTGVVLLTTHLESGYNTASRQVQCREIATRFHDNHLVLFGDTNLRDEAMTDDWTLLGPTGFTRDGTLNPNVAPNCRERLDRFYTNRADMPSKEAVIMTHVTVSDHFPVLISCL
jgi:endonuclease/exonuclease/phosphatase family metal-dependent hydrolase